MCVDERFCSGLMTGEVLSTVSWAVADSEHLGKSLSSRVTINHIFYSPYFLSVKHHRFYLPRQVYLDYLLSPCESIEKVEI